MFPADRGNKAGLPGHSQFLEGEHLTLGGRRLREAQRPCLEAEGAGRGLPRTSLFCCPCHTWVGTVMGKKDRDPHGSCHAVGPSLKKPACRCHPPGVPEHLGMCTAGIPGDRALSCRSPTESQPSPGCRGRCLGFCQWHGSKETRSKELERFC